MNISLQINSTLSPSSAASSDLLQLFVAGAEPTYINLTLKYRKHCRNQYIQQPSTAYELYKKNVAARQQPTSSDFTIAYITIATLTGFALVVFFTTITLCVSKKISRRAAAHARQLIQFGGKKSQNTARVYGISGLNADKSLTTDNQYARNESNANRVAVYEIFFFLRDY